MRFYSSYIDYKLLGPTWTKGKCSRALTETTSIVLHHYREEILTITSESPRIGGTDT